MEKNTRKVKGLAVLIALAIAVTASIGGAYMWFYVQSSDASGSGNAATIDLDVDPATSVTFKNVLPGEPIDMAGASVKVDVNRFAILKISLNAPDEAELNGSIADVTGHGDWLPAYDPTDYTNDGTVYSYTTKRLNEILEIGVASTANITLRPSAKYPNTYYALVGENDSGKDILSSVSVKFTGEFGGGYVSVDSNGDKVGSPSASRQFEQQSTFDGIGLDAALVQCTREAVLDVWTKDVLDDILANTALMGDIAAETDAVESWGYTG